MGAVTAAKKCTSVPFFNELHIHQTAKRSKQPSAATTKKPRRDSLRSAKGREALGQKQGKTLLLFTTGESHYHRYSLAHRSWPRYKPVGCLSRSYGNLGDATPPILSSSNIDMTPSSRSRTHQNQSQPGRSCPPLPARTRSCRLSLRRLSPPAGRVSALRA